MTPPSTVLVVDDVEMNRFLVQEILEADGVHVVCVAGGQEALDVFLDRFAPGDLSLAYGFELTRVPVPFLFGPQSVDVTLAPTFEEGNLNAR